MSSSVHKSPTPEPESISPHDETSHKLLDLKPLPSELKYVHLGPSASYLVIVAFDLTSVQEAQLVDVLQQHKSTLGWTISDLKGISPAICNHRIHLEEGAKPY